MFRLISYIHIYMVTTMIRIFILIFFSFSSVVFAKDTVTQSSKIDLLETQNLEAKQVTFGSEFIFSDWHIFELTPEFQSKFGLSFSSKGLIILGSAIITSRLGVRRDDLLYETNGKLVDKIKGEISSISCIKSSGGITVIRSGGRFSLRFRL